MKRFSFTSMHLGYEYCIVLFALLFVFTTTEAQKIYSDDELLSTGTDYYNNNKYLQAEIYLFAYTQRNTNSYQSNSDFKLQIDQALKYCDAHSSTAGAIAMFDLKTTKDANGHVHTVITKLGGAKPTINTNSLPASNAALNTGKYSCDDGGIYYVTVVNNEVWWFGNSNDKSWADVMHGYISGNEIKATWADVPCCSKMNSGTVTLLINDSESFSIKDQTGDFAGTVWKIILQNEKKASTPKKK